jgi:hypothetical protein
MIVQGAWRKSSYSSGSDANCVEVAAWGKSSYSSGDDANCVEVATSSTTVGVRDTKDRAAGHLTIPAPAWTAFLNSAARTR